jgi:hypothetical protein
MLNKTLPHRLEATLPSDLQNEDREWHGEILLGRKWSIYQGNAEEVLKRLPAESVNCVVTSPPYFWTDKKN